MQLGTSYILGKTDGRQGVEQEKRICTRGYLSGTAVTGMLGIVL